MEDHIDRRTPSNLELLQGIERLDKRVGKLETKWNVLMGIVTLVGVAVLPLADIVIHLVIK